VSRSKEEELAKLHTMRKLLPFGSKALDARIAQLQSSRANLPAVKVGELLLVDKALENERDTLRIKTAQKEEVARKCFSFWWGLEQQFAAAEKRAPESSVELLQWFWKGKGEFVEAYRKRVGKTALAYL